MGHWMLCAVVFVGAATGTEGPLPAKDPIREAYEAHAPTPALPFPEAEDLKSVPDPDPLVFFDGHPVKTQDDWAARRREIMDLLHHYIYGFCGPEQLVAGTPPPEVAKEEKDALGGLAIRREIKVPICPDTNGPEGVMWLSVVLPNTGQGPFPTVLQFDRPGQFAEYAVKRGYAFAGFSPQSGVCMYKHYFPIHSGPWVDNSVEPFASMKVKLQGRRPLYGWGERTVWAWRMRRMMDALVAQKDVDAGRVIFVGGSRGGQSVLMAAAMDERAAMVYCWQGLPRIRNYNWPDRPEWLAPEVQKFSGRLDRLPVDLYCAAAVIAPRPILFTEARAGKGYTYSASPSVYEKVAGVYRFLGADVGMEQDPGPGHEGLYSHGVLGMHIRDGDHTWMETDWKHMLDFADAYLKANPRKETAP